MGRGLALWTRRFTPAGFPFAFAGRDRLLTLAFKEMLLGPARWKSGCPPLLEPSLKVERDTAHNRNSGFVAPVSNALTRAVLQRSTP
jgi:hypothetical protein